MYKMADTKARKDKSEKKAGEDEYTPCFNCSDKEGTTWSLGKFYCVDCIKAGRDNNPGYRQCPNYGDYNSPNYVAYMKTVKRD